MKLRLNLSTAPRENKRPFIATAALLGTLGVLALLILSHAAYKSWRGNRDIRVEIARLESDIRVSQRKQHDLETYFQSLQAQQVLNRSGFLNSLIDQRSFPWTKIFMDLERTLPPGVRVVTISPRLQNGRAEVTFSVGASSDEARLKFLEALEKSKVFSKVQVKAEHRPDQVTGQDKIVLDLSVWYETT